MHFNLFVNACDLTLPDILQPFNQPLKFEGVHLDKNLNWNHRLKSVKNKAPSAVFALSNVKNILPSNIKLTIYNSLFDHIYRLWNFGLEKKQMFGNETNSHLTETRNNINQ